MGWTDAPIAGSGKTAQKWSDAPLAGNATADAARNVVGQYKDGTIYRDKAGKLSFVSPGYSTIDAKTIEGMMAGITPAQTGQDQLDQQRIDANPVASRALKVIEGIPFVGTWADNAVGMASPDAAANMRAASDAMARQNPVQSGALNVLGAIGGSIPMAMAAGPIGFMRQGVTLGSRAIGGAIGGAAIGGAEGVVSGYGRGGADDAVKSGLIGAALGGAIGGALPVISDGVKAAFGALKGSTQGVIAARLGISSEAAKVVKAAIDAGDINQAVAALNRAGPNAMLAEAGKPATQLLDAAANTGGAAARIADQAVGARATQAAGELTGALDTVLGKPVGAASIAKDIRTGTAAAREAAYNAAYARPIDYSGGNGRALEGMIGRLPRDAISKANAMMRAEGVQSQQIIIKELPNGGFTVERLPDVRQWDYITRALGDVAAETDGAGKLGGKTQLGNVYSSLVGTIRGVLKTEVPEYGAALKVSSDAIGRVEASKLGYTLLKPGTTREDVSMAIRSGTPRAEIKAGVRSYIDDAMANVTKAMSDPNMDAREAIKALRDMSSRSAQTKLRYILSGDEYRKLMTEVDKASAVFDFRSALAANSKTAIRQSIQGQVKLQTQPGMLEALSSGEVTTAGKRFVQLFTGNSTEAQALREAGIYEEIVTALTGQKGAAAQASLAAVKQAMSGRKITPYQAELIGRTVSGLALAASHEAGQSQSTLPSGSAR